MTRDFTTPARVQTPIKIEVKGINLHGADKIQVQVGGHSRLVLDPADASKLAWAIWDALGERRPAE